MVYKWLNIALSLLYPHHCPLCGSPTPRPFCDACERDMPVLVSRCAQCGLGIPVVSNNLLCGQCQIRPPPFQRLLSPYAYTHPINHLIIGLKYQRQLSLVPVLADALANHVTRNLIGVDALLPVPLHPDRLRERGFNQSLELARHLRKRLDLPILDNIERHRATMTQSTLPAGARETNVRGAFRLREPVLPKRVAIVDDVVTTGSTVNEIANVLRSGGVETIEVWCVARAV